MDLPTNNDLQLGEIAEWIGNKLALWGRIYVSQTKEKYHSVRVYCSFGHWQVHTIIFPRWGRKHKLCPQWLWELDCHHGLTVLRPFQWLTVKYQEFVYRRVYIAALKKWPECDLNIWVGADRPDLLEHYKPLAKKLKLIDNNDHD